MTEETISTISSNAYYSRLAKTILRLQDEIGKHPLCKLVKIIDIEKGIVYAEKLKEKYPNIRSQRVALEEYIKDLKEVERAREHISNL